jgi:hypothetical protein
MELDLLYVKARQIECTFYLSLLEIYFMAFGQKYFFINMLNENMLYLSIFHM